MRFSKLIFIGILLIVVGVILMFRDQTESKTRACERRIRKAATAVCTWTDVGETRVWNLALEDHEELFMQFQQAMLDDLNALREEGTSVAIPEYLILLKDKDGEHPFEFKIYIGNASWIECGGGTYPDQGHTTKFLRDHEKDFVIPSEDTTE